jgi:hypothetical protein
VIAFAVLYGTGASAQWLNHPDARLPRTADGKVVLDAPPPRTADGKPDLSGVWQFRLGLAYSMNVVADLRQQEIARWADDLFRTRLFNLGVDDSSIVGCLPRGPRLVLGAGALSQFVKIAQTSDVTYVFSEELAYRQIFTDGRTLPADPNPTFMGYSVGHWEKETFVVESTGFNDRTWLDYGGHPHTAQLRTIERFKRVSVGKMELEVTLSDPRVYTRPWTVPVSVTLAPDTDLLEAVCNEQQYRRTAIGLTSAEKAVRVPASVLAEYVGTYEFAGNPAGRRFTTVTIRLQGSDLVVDWDGKGNVPLVPLTETLFSAQIFNLEFFRDQSGRVTHAINPETGARFNRR